MTLEHATTPARCADKVAQFEAVKRWFEDDWTRIEPKLRTSIIEGISVSRIAEGFGIEDP